MLLAKKRQIGLKFLQVSFKDSHFLIGALSRLLPPFIGEETAVGWIRNFIQQEIFEVRKCRSGKALITHIDMPLIGRVTFQRQYAITNFGQIRSKVLRAGDELDFDIAEPAQVLPLTNTLIRTHFLRTQRFGFDRLHRRRTRTRCRCDNGSRRPIPKLAVPGLQVTQPLFLLQASILRLYQFQLGL